MFSQQSSLNSNDDTQSQSNNQELRAVSTTASSCSTNDGPLEDYTKYNASLPPVAKVRSANSCVNDSEIAKSTLFCSMAVTHFY